MQYGKGHRELIIEAMEPVYDVLFGANGKANKTVRNLSLTACFLSLKKENCLPAFLIYLFLIGTSLLVEF